MESLVSFPTRTHRKKQTKDMKKEVTKMRQILLFFIAPRRQIMENDNNNKKCIR